MHSENAIVLLIICKHSVNTLCQSSNDADTCVFDIQYKDQMIIWFFFPLFSYHTIILQGAISNTLFYRKTLHNYISNFEHIYPNLFLFDKYWLNKTHFQQQQKIKILKDLKYDQTLKHFNDNSIEGTSTFEAYYEPEPMVMNERVYIKGNYTFSKLS